MFCSHIFILEPPCLNWDIRLKIPIPGFSRGSLLAIVGAHSPTALLVDQRTSHPETRARPFHTSALPASLTAVCPQSKLSNGPFCECRGHRESYIRTKGIIGTYGYQPWLQLQISAGTSLFFSSPTALVGCVHRLCLGIEGLGNFNV